ncbi:MAG: GNAT family N-acetyltransferase [Christensenellaceae bacterium]|nr:GNAT family N-acetyltransferase [Christensenellaceae bacterium]
MIIETDRLTIRALEASDGKAFADMASDGSLKDVGLDRECRQWIEEWIAESRKLTDRDDPAAEYLAYAIERKDAGGVIGSVGCSYYEDLGKAGITYFIGANDRNRGYASEAVQAYARYFLRHYGVGEIIATIREENVSSWRVIEKAGFRLIDRRMYRDVNDAAEEPYRFYAMTKRRLDETP